MTKTSGAKKKTSRVKKKVIVIRKKVSAAKKKGSKPSVDGSALVNFTKNRNLDDACKKAELILKYTHESVQVLFQAYNLIREQRGGMGGPRDEEQDILRTMLIMASSGIDAMIKQLAKDSVLLLIDKNTPSFKKFEIFIERRIYLRDKEIKDEINKKFIDSKFLAGILAVKNQRAKLIEEYINDLTADSLQSAESLRGMIEKLGISGNDISIDMNELQKIFEVRNKIIHELDINFEHSRRNRNQRRVTDMIRNTNVLLNIGSQFLIAIDTILKDN